MTMPALTVLVAAAFTGYVVLVHPAAEAPVVAAAAVATAVVALNRRGDGT